MQLSVKKYQTLYMLILLHTDIFGFLSNQPTFFQNCLCHYKVECNTFFLFFFFYIQPHLRGRLFSISIFLSESGWKGPQDLTYSELLPKAG